MDKTEEVEHTEMSFKEALEILGISEYGERIWKSNSHGELFHLDQYIGIAEVFGKTEWFAEWFKQTVKWAEENWERPESIFQHINKILIEQLQKQK